MWRLRKFDESLVILGSGFAGVACAQRLARLMRRDRERVHIALVDRENYLVFQPLLPEVAAATIEVAHVVNPIRQLVPDVDFDCAEVEDIDFQRKIVTFRSPEGLELAPMPYTQLVLSLGTTPNLGIIPGMAEHGLPMKTVGDAFHLRNHLVTRLELAANVVDKAIRAELLTVVVVGGGFSGVETCAEILDMLEGARRYYPELADDHVRAVLVASTKVILPALSSTLSEYALVKLRGKGVEVMLGERVTSVTPRACFLGSGKEIRARTVVCTVGDAPHPAIERLALPKERGRIVVNADLSVPGFDGVWAIGDCAYVINGDDKKPCPPTAQFSTRMGEQVAENIARVLHKKPTTPFSFRSQGYLASLGHRTAVAEVFGIRLSGFLAWWVWRTIYLFKLPGVGRKVRVAFDWTLDLIFPRDVLQLRLSRSDSVARRHYEPGQDIVRQGDSGDSFFAIVRGECDVQRCDDSGTHCTVARLGPGATFGEEALLTGKPRSATVRAATPVDVVVLGRSDFAALQEHLHVVRHAARDVVAIADAKT